LSLASFWPGSLFLVSAVFWGWRQRRAPAQRFLIAWLLPAWIFCELMPTKLPHYILPLYPALALLAGGVLQGLPLPLSGHVRRLEGIVTVLWGAISIILIGALVALPVCLGAGVSVSVVIAAVVLLGLAMLLLLNRRRPLVAAALVGMLAAGFALPAAGVVVPALDLLWLSRAATTVVAHHQPRRDEAVLSVGYSGRALSSCSARGPAWSLQPRRTSALLARRWTGQRA
jgi:4-amino-4-deoxy-L-arabinose transferase-like glycosyltransferase